MVTFWSIFWLKWYLLVLNVLLLILELVPEVRFGIRETILAFWASQKKKNWHVLKMERMTVS